ncbi:hypothetical protein VTO42DRAFT_6635 [Malbranchea cinnamomea]
MRFLYVAVSAFAALAAAQSTFNENPFNVPEGGYEFTAGEPTTLTWEPTTDGTVTIKLHYGDDITPESGMVLASNIPNSGSFTWAPPADLGVGEEYTIEIIDDENEDNINFTPRFSIDGVTGTQTGLPEETASATATASETASVTETTDATTTETATSTTEDATTATTFTTATSTTTEESATTEESTTTSEATPTRPQSTMTVAPDPDGNGAMSLTLPGGLLSAVLALMALL